MRNRNVTLKTLAIVGSAGAALAGAFFLGRATAAESQPKPQVISIASVFAKSKADADAPYATTPLASGRSASAVMIRVEKEIKPHASASSEEWDYVMRGGGTALFGADRRPAKAGDLIYVPRGVSHGFLNGARAGTLLLSVTAPPSESDSRR